MTQHLYGQLNPQAMFGSQFGQSTVNPAYAAWGGINPLAQDPITAAYLQQQLASQAFAQPVGFGGGAQPFGGAFGQQFGGGVGAQYGQTPYGIDPLTAIAIQQQQQQQQLLQLQQHLAREQALRQHLLQQAISGGLGSQYGAQPFGGVQQSLGTPFGLTPQMGIHPALGRLLYGGITPQTSQWSPYQFAAGAQQQSPWGQQSPWAQQLGGGWQHQAGIGSPFGMQPGVSGSYLGAVAGQNPFINPALSALGNIGAFSGY
jgi:hypothetical protein